MNANANGDEFEKSMAASADAAAAASADEYTKGATADGDISKWSLPELIFRAGEVQAKIKAAQEEADHLRQQALIHFRTLGIRSAESGPYVASHVISERVNINRGTLAGLFGNQWMSEAEASLRSKGCVTKTDTLTIRKRTERKPEEKPTSDDRDMIGEVQAFFG